MSLRDFYAYLAKGVDVVQSCTGAWINPDLAIEIRSAQAEDETGATREVIRIGIEHIPVRPPRREPTSTYHIERRPDGFEVTNAEEFAAGKFFQWGSPETVEKVLDEVILPRIRQNPDITPDQLMSQAQADKAALQRVGLRDVPWTALYLLTQWRLAQAPERREDQPQDPAFDRAVELLARVYKPLRVMHQMLADPGPFRTR